MDICIQQLYLFLGTIVTPLLRIRTLNKYPPITSKPPIPIIISVFTQRIGAYNPLLHLALKIFFLWFKEGKNVNQRMANHNTQITRTKIACERKYNPLFFTLCFGWFLFIIPQLFQCFFPRHFVPIFCW